MKLLQRTVLATLMLLLASCATKAPIYAGRPIFPALNPDILQHSMFTGAPTPKVKQLNYRSFAYPSGKPFSRYTIYPETTRGNITEYQTNEISANNTLSEPHVRGEGVGYGGIFMLLYRKRGSVPHQSQFYQKYAMTSVSNVSGKLFSLKVGNELKFHYTAVATYKHQAETAPADKDSGIMIYRVVEKLDHYKNVNANVPGPIYKIVVKRTTRAEPTLHTQYAYYFSPKLGWYIWAQYFSRNKLIANYKLVGYLRI